MIYDVHTHVGLDQAFYLRAWWPYAATAQDLLQQMDASAIDRAVVFPFGLPSAFDSNAFARRGRIELLPGRVPFDRENELLLKEVERIDLSGRLRVLAMFDPSRCVPQQVERLHRIADRVVGLKVQATILESPLAALKREGRALMDLAEQRGWPVLFHTSVLPEDLWSQGETCLEIAAAHPAARFNLAHSIRFDRRLLEQAARADNVWVDCSAHLAHCQLAREDSPAVALGRDRVDADYSKPAAVLESIHAMMNGKYMWGSDNPFMSWCDDTIRAVYSYREEAEALHALPDAVRTSMGQTAPRAWLGEAD